MSLEIWAIGRYTGWVENWLKSINITCTPVKYPRVIRRGDLFTSTHVPDSPIGLWYRQMAVNLCLIFVKQNKQNLSV